MRKKEELLKDVRETILNEKYKDKESSWIQYNLIEVLVDIRDELHNLNQSVGSNMFDHMRES